MKNQNRPLRRTRPATDILEKADGFYIYMDMPGVSHETLALDLDDNELRVSGKADYSEFEAANYHAVEFGSGEYRRSFTLSDMVDRENIKACLTNGVLEIFLPRRERAAPKRITIQTTE